MDCLVDCRSVDEFDTKLEGLKPDWEALVPGFAQYFERNKAQKIKDYYLVPRREIVNLSGSGRTTTNAVEAVNSLLQQTQGGRKLPVDETIKCLEKYTNTVLNSLALSVLEGKGGKFQLKPDFHYLKLTGLQFTAMEPQQRVEHWRKVALDPPEEAVPEGFTEIRLKIPNVSTTEVHDLLSFAEVLNCDRDALRQTVKSPNVFTVPLSLPFNLHVFLLQNCVIYRRSVRTISSK